MARVRIFAGPNGSGKTSLFKSLSQQYSVNFGIYLNPDNLAESIKASLSLNLAQYHLNATQKKWDVFYARHGLKARVRKTGNPVFASEQILFDSIPDDYLIAVLTDFLRYRAMAGQQTFSFETVFSHPDKIRFIDEANKKGFRTYLYFVCLADPSMNKERVDLRVKMGGHDVPRAKIHKRYFKSIENLLPAMKRAHRTYIFDSSGTESRMIASVPPSGTLRLETSQVPVWFDEHVLSKLDSDPIGL